MIDTFVLSDQSIKIIRKIFNGLNILKSVNLDALNLRKTKIDVISKIIFPSPIYVKPSK